MKREDTLGWKKGSTEEGGLDGSPERWPRGTQEHTTRALRKAAETERRAEWTLQEQRAREMDGVKAVTQPMLRGSQREEGDGQGPAKDHGTESTGAGCSPEGAWDLTTGQGGWCLQCKPSDAVQLLRG